MVGYDVIPPYIKKDNINMTCCSEYQTECLRVVTIAYLKSFIGTDIQNSSGAAVTISRTDDTYCPTYAELTNGSIIPYWSQGGTPNGDMDGIIVNSRCTGTNFPYATNQLVNQRDLSMMYTRFKSFSVSSAAGDVDECGGTKSVSYTHNYTRYTRSMSNACTTSTTSEDVSDTANGEVTWTPACDWISVNGTSLVATVSTQPATRTVNRRCCTVNASVTFRTTPHTSSTQICQEALTGEWVYSGTSYYNLTTTASTLQLGCCGGSYGINGTGYYFERNYWKDSCDRIYGAPYYDHYGTEALSGQISNNGYYVGGVFPEAECCHADNPNCCEGRNESDTLTIAWHGISSSYTFSQVCETKTDCCTPFTAYTFDDITIPCTLAESRTVNAAYTLVTVNSNCERSTTTGTTEKTIPSVDCNPNNTRRVIQEGNTASTLANANPRVIQSEGPCCASSVTVVFDDVTVPCASAESFTSAITYTQTITRQGQNPEVTTGTTEKTIPSVDCNPSGITRVIQEGNTATTLEGANPRVIQSEGPCCPVLLGYVYDDIYLPCEESDAKTVTVTYSSMTEEYGGSITVVTAETEWNVPSVECNTGDTKTIQVGSSASTLAEASPTIYQEGGECDCDYTTCTLKTGSTDDGSSVISLSRTGGTLAFDVSNCGNVDDCVELLETTIQGFSDRYIQKFKVINTGITSTNYSAATFSNKSNNIRNITISNFQSQHRERTFQVNIELINIGSTSVSFSYTMEFKTSRIGGTTICSKSVEYNEQNNE